MTCIVVSHPSFNAIVCRRDNYCHPVNKSGEQLWEGEVYLQLNTGETIKERDYQMATPKARSDMDVVGGFVTCSWCGKHFNPMV